jgi:hypothetical protein
MRLSVVTWAHCSMSRSFGIGASVFDSPAASIRTSAPEAAFGRSTHASSRASASATGIADRNTRPFGADHDRSPLVKVRPSPLGADATTTG